jgi:hypothetical protein
MTPNDKVQGLQENLGHEPKKAAVMFDVTALWRKVKKWRKGKHEKINFGGSIDVCNDSVNDAIDRANLRR